MRVVFLVSVEKKTHSKNHIHFFEKTRELFIPWFGPEGSGTTLQSSCQNGGSRMDEESGEDGSSSFIGKKWDFNKNHQD